MSTSILKNITLAVLLIGISMYSVSCKKKDDNNSNQTPNELKISDGEFAGYSHVYSPNMGFWSIAAASVRYVHLVLGDNSNQVGSAPEVMDIVFYSSNQGSIHFPSTDGQWINFGLTFQGVVYYFTAQSADLTITDLTDNHFRGTLQGDFVDASNGSRTLSINILIDIDMQQI